VDGRDAGIEQLEIPRKDPVDLLARNVISGWPRAQIGDEPVAARIFDDRFALVLRLRYRHEVRDPVKISGIEIAAEYGRTVRGDGRPKIIKLPDLFLLIDAIVLMDADDLRTAPRHRDVAQEGNANTVFEMKLIPREAHGAVTADRVAAEDGQALVRIALKSKCFGKHETHPKRFRDLFCDMKPWRIDDFLEEEDVGFAKIGFGGQFRNEFRTWAEKDPLMRAYHDEEWGVPEYDSRALWEKLMLDGFQAGLSWAIILRKREAFRKAFRGFVPEKVARFGEKDIERLLADAGIVRSRAKIEATIAGAREYLAMQKAGEDFSRFIWDMAGGKPVENSGERPTKSALSEEISKALRKRGFKFTGPVIVYAWMQAVGIVNDHSADCFRRSAVRSLAKQRSE
jgi:DNA-3-methyladenine glycosylase I